MTKEDNEFLYVLYAYESLLQSYELLLGKKTVIEMKEALRRVWVEEGYEVPEGY